MHDLKEQTFSDFRWADIAQTGLSRGTSPRDWTAEHALAVEAFEHNEENDCTLTLPEWRLLVSAAASGLPVILTTRTRGGQTRATYIVTQLFGLSSGTAALYTRRWGFSYPLGLRNLVAVEAPAVEYS